VTLSNGVWTGSTTTGQPYTPQALGDTDVITGVSVVTQGGLGGFKIGVSPSSANWSLYGISAQELVVPSAPAPVPAPSSFFGVILCLSLIGMILVKRHLNMHRQFTSGGPCPTGSLLEIIKHNESGPSYF